MYGSVTDKHGEVFNGYLRVYAATSVQGYTVQVFDREEDAKPGPDYNPRVIVHGDVTIDYRSPKEKSGMM